MNLILKRFFLASIITTVAIACRSERRQCWQCDYTYKGTRADSTGDTILCRLTKTDVEIRQDKEFGTNVNGYTTWVITNCQAK